MDLDAALLRGRRVVENNGGDEGEELCMHPTSIIIQRYVPSKAKQFHDKYEVLSSEHTNFSLR